MFQRFPQIFSRNVSNVGISQIFPGSSGIPHGFPRFPQGSPQGPGDGALHLLPRLGGFEDALALGDPELEDGVAPARGLAQGSCGGRWLVVGGWW